MMAPPELGEYYVFTGGERVPRHVTHVFVDEIKFVRANAFQNHPNIEEVIFHDGVEIIEEGAFNCCRRLRRVIMPGVKRVEKHAFNGCEALTYIECGKLEIIEGWAFVGCESLSSVDMPSAKIVGEYAFNSCWNLINAKFGKNLKSIGEMAFRCCRSLERITIPLKDGLISQIDTFQACENLHYVDLVEGVVLNETISALLLEEWKHDMNNEIDFINRILPNTSSGTDRYLDAGGKGWATQRWIGSVLLKIVGYKAEHRRYLNEAAATLQPALPNDIVLKNVFPYIELPSFTFEGENYVFPYIELPSFTFEGENYIEMY